LVEQSVKLSPICYPEEFLAPLVMVDHKDHCLLRRKSSNNDFVFKLFWLNFWIQFLEN